MTGRGLIRSAAMVALIATATVASPGLLAGSIDGPVGHAQATHNPDHVNDDLEDRLNEEDDPVVDLVQDTYLCAQAVGGSGSCPMA